MRTYDTNHKLTEIETLNCGQSDGLISSGTSQYVDGPVAYLESKITYEPNLIEPNTPGRRGMISCGGPQNGGKQMHQESFYSTPLQPGHGKANPGYILGEKAMQPYITATLRKQGQGSGAACTSINIAIDPRNEAIYGDLLNRAQTSGTSHQQQQQQATPQVQFSTHHQTHPYYTHSLITTNAPANHPESGHPNRTGRDQSDHVYELPKQHQLTQSQQFDQKVGVFFLLILIQDS